MNDNSFISSLAEAEDVYETGQAKKFWFLTADMDKPELKMVDIYWGSSPLCMSLL